MPHLLNVWPNISRRLRDAGNVLLLLDFDGTLAPIVDRPDLAALPPDTRETLLILSRREKYIIGIISARSLEDVSEKVSVDEFIYAGNHGLEIRGPALNFVHPEAKQLTETIDRVYQLLQQGLSRVPGIFIEHKGLSLTVHYRLTREDLVAEVKNTVEELTRPFLESGTLLVSPGKMALEVRPGVSWDKGNAISKVQEAFPQVTMTFYFGDDIADEAGFTTVQESGGLGVFVGPALEPTVAIYRLDSPREVTETLDLMARL